ncbi:LytTR family DNA-binding domain-containing protein [Terrimonas sp. NA20]|uniref:LytTR family DNA-binding domain-containing protein n=1 Tax=Terrimonas ginsenosidimutans TaxID=2908004 RepID=A0ABS9L0I2_9BACT|nr:LytTR family DNA-binding domain-containing protein [Terrimonas ginsenosidimutans]MCG2618065.1 LytTR family DNA-binding domain-containing protein [Terrimonas ginsenosidimutans]
MNIVIVDDNKIARTTLKQLASRVKDLVVVAECENAIDARDVLQNEPVDLLLLDIEMPEMSGLELTRDLGTKRPLIIFTTSRKDYAVEAFELNVVDYIVKPVTLSRFIQAIDKARDIRQSDGEEMKVSTDAFLFIRDSSVVRRLSIEDILYAEAMGDYVKLHTSQKFYAVHTTLKAVEERLPSNQFLRIHRSFIAALSRIDTIQDGAVVVNGKSLPVADAYRAGLNKRMNIL